MAGEYRRLLYREGIQVRDSSGKVVRRGIEGDPGSPGPVGRLGNRVRYFVDGAAIGSREFLDGIFDLNRDCFGPRRKTGPRRFRGPDWKDSGWYALRDLSSPG